MYKIKQKIEDSYKILFIINFMLILIFPYLNSLTHLVKNESLSGVTVESKKPVYTVKSYLSGEYQKDFDKYYLEKFPYRNVYIKSYNQIKYSLFNEGSVVIGKDNYLFEKPYIDEYLGINIENRNQQQYMTDLLDDIKTINETCKNNQKDFYILITPSKAEFCSEYISDRYYKIATNSSGYKRYYYELVSELNNNNIKFFDTCKYLKEIHIDTPIFYKTGIHWSFMASTYALSDFIKYINSTSTLNLREFNVIGNEKAEKEFFEQDADIYNLLNIYKGEKDKLYYKPIIEFDNNKNTEKKLLIQGGSFNWNLLEYMKKDIFTNIDHLHYKKFVRNYNKDGNTKDTKITKNTLKKEEIDNLLKDKDIIILEVNQENIQNWRNTASGFISDLRVYLEKYGFPT